MDEHQQQQLAKKGANNATNKETNNLQMLVIYYRAFDIHDCDPHFVCSLRRQSIVNVVRSPSLLALQLHARKPLNARN